MPAPTLNGTGTGTASSTTTVSATLTSPGTNNIICALVYIEHAAVSHWLTGVSGGGLTWSKRTQATVLPGVNNGHTLELWWALAPSALSAVAITATCNSAFDDAAMLVFGVAGCNTTNPWDSNVSLAARSVATNITSAIAPFTGISTTQANDFLIFGWGVANSQAIGTVPTGFTQINATQNPGGVLYASIGAAYMGVTATQTNQTFAWGSTLTASASGAAIFDALSADSGGGTTSPRPTWETLTQQNAVTTNTRTFNAAGVTANSVIVVVSYCEATSAPAISSISGGGLTWTLRSRSHGSSRGSLEVWYAQVTGTLASTSITINYAATFDSVSLSAFSVAGCSSSVWDSAAGLPKLASNTAGGSWTPSVSSVSTAQAHDMVLAATGVPQAAGGIRSVPSGFFLLDEVIRTGGTFPSYLGSGTQARGTTQSGATIAWAAAIADNAGASAGGEYVVDALTADVVSAAPTARQYAVTVTI